jgi:hypothetical protein
LPELTVSVSERDKTKDVHLNLSKLPDRVYVENRLWVSTAYGKIRVGIDRGPIYELVDGVLQRLG